MKNQYVILTGGKNNAGDFLIKYRAKDLFKTIRPDRDIIDLNAWESFDSEKVKLINESRALILMGGPALVKNMVPQVYNLAQVIDLIKVPIILMGVGWKSKRGRWSDTIDYELNKTTLYLLNKVKNSGYISSVRDFYTLELLRSYGIENVVMTGCPAYYDRKYLGNNFGAENIERVAFSLGVSHLESPAMLVQMNEIILNLNSRYNNKLQVVFHHSLNREKYLNNDRALSHHQLKHNKIADWLELNEISYVDISGSAEALIAYYSKIDLHIGYRVHAHIFMNSVSRKSVLISEDGRAKGVKSVIYGTVLDGYLDYRVAFSHKILSKLFSSYSRYSANEDLLKQLNHTLDYEELTNYTNMKISREVIDLRYNDMRTFINQLP